MTHAQHIRNLLVVYDRGTDRDRAEACASYQRYHDLIGEIASQTGHSLRIAVGVFSALSPNNDYISNLKNLRTLLKAELDGKTIEDFRVNTYNANKRKAWAMARDRVDPLELFKGRKTKAFFLNCFDPTDPEPITVDGHMYWAWMGKKGAVNTRASKRTPETIPSLSQTVYNEIADGIRLVGEIRGVIGNQAQAILWQNWRRMHNVLGSAQMELIASDVFAAGNHNHKHATGGCGQ